MKISVVLDEGLLGQIDQAAEIYEVNRSIFIRFAVKHELERLGLVAPSSHKLLPVIKMESR